jgi:GT2 family glycosyltransferase
MRASVVIPVYGQPHVVTRCLDALFHQGVAEGTEVVVVDDASPDGTGDMLAEMVKQGANFRLARHQRNVGFAASCNDGAALSTGAYVVFLNSDTVPRAGWLDALTHHADTHPVAGAVGAKLLSLDGRIQHAGVVIGQDRNPHHLYAGFPADHPAVSRTRRFQVVTAACILVPADRFATLGGFDTSFHNGHEDVDLCLRLGAAGYEVWYCADSVLVHLESVSRDPRSADASANGRLYRDRWASTVVPDDLLYYAEDGLLQLAYADGHPIRLSISPLLATIDGDSRWRDAERLLRVRSEQVAELLRTLVLMATGTSPLIAPADEVSDDELSAALSALLEAASHRSYRAALDYRRLVRRVRRTVEQVTATASTVAVISHGDDALIDLNQRLGLHFPAGGDGRYAGRHPATSAEALETLRSTQELGAQYLVVPDPSRWWLDHYREFAHHLHAVHELVADDDNCLVFALRADTGNP